MRNFLSETVKLKERKTFLTLLRLSLSTNTTAPSVYFYQVGASECDNPVTQIKVFFAVLIEIVFFFYF